jgi:hypothetical protein
VLAVTILLAFGLTATAAITRFNSIGLLNSDQPKGRIFEFTTLGTESTPKIVLRAFYNKPVFYSLLFAEHYLAHFTPTFILLKGNTDRQIIPAQGVFYLIEALLMCLGLYYL